MKKMITKNNSSPTVFHVTAKLSHDGGGVMESLCSLSNELQKSGNVDLIIGGGGPPLTVAEQSRYDVKNAFNFPIQRFGPLLRSRELENALQSNAPDLIHAHTVWGLATRTLAKSQPVCPYLVSVHGMLEPWTMQQQRWKRRIAWHAWVGSVLRRANCLHALCDAEKESFRHQGLVNPVAIIPNGIDLPPKSAYNTDGPIVFLGRIHPKKGIRELLHAWENGMPQLDIAGWDDGGHEKELRELHAKKQLTNVRFVGSAYGEEKSKLLRNASAIILASHSEGLPMAILEGWSHGLPVIMTDECHLPDGFTANAALRITPDPDSIRSVVQNFSSLTESERSAIGKNGRSLVERKFTWETIAEQFHSVYRWLLNTGSQPPCVVD